MAQATGLLIFTDEPFLLQRELPAELSLARVFYSLHRQQPRAPRPECCRVGTRRGTAVAALFRVPPTEPDLIAFPSSGSPVTRVFCLRLVHSFVRCGYSCDTTNIRRAFFFCELTSLLPTVLFL